MALEAFRQECNVEVRIDPSVGKAPDVLVDAALAVEALRNVIENAMKFNDKARKTVDLSAQTIGGFVRLTVRDNGVGIPPEERTKVFERFYQVENHFTGQVPGAGLGLALCKKVIEGMGGGVSIESDIGAGTRVLIDLPRSSAAK